MKKKYIPIIIIVLLVCFIFFGTYGCSPNEIYFMVNQDNYHKTKLTKIIDALEQEDMETIKGLFSKAVINEVGEETIEDGIRYLFTVFEGDVVSSNLGGGGYYGETYRNGRKLKRTILGATTKTDVGEYSIICHDYIFNAIDYKNTGIINLKVLPLNESEKYGTLGEDFIGVFRQDQYAYAVDAGLSEEATLNCILDAMENKDKDAIKNLFTKEAINKAYGGEYDIDNGIEHIFSIYKGSLVSYEKKETYAYRKLIINAGKIEMSFERAYTVTTDKDKYVVFFTGYIVNETSPELVGIKQLEVALLEDDYSLSGNKPGIVQPH